MAEKINWSFVAQIPRGPSISGSGNLEVEAYEIIDFTIPGKNKHDVCLSNTSTISLLIINSATPNQSVTYTAEPSLPVNRCTLDGPQIFIGKLAQSFFAAGAESVTTSKVSFTNDTENEIHIQILIGRSTA